MNKQLHQITSGHELAWQRCEARHDSFLQAIRGWRVRVDCAKSGSLVLIEQSQQVLITPQSVWVKFQVSKTALALSGRVNLTIEAETTLNGSCCVPLITSLDFRPPRDDLEMLMQSHREGLYVWNDNEAEGMMYDGEDSLVSIMAYLHYEQSFLALAKLGLLDCLPQSLPLPAMPSYWPSNIASTASSSSTSSDRDTLFICLDWSHLGASSSETKKITRGSAVAILHQRRSSIFSSDISGIRLALPPIDRRSLMVVKPILVERSEAKIEALEALCSSDGMIDFSIWNSCGRLILGRAGVELWLKDEDEEPDQTYCCHFLIDGGPKEQSLWSNCLWIRPRSNGANIIELNLPLEISSLLLE